MSTQDRKIRIELGAGYGIQYNNIMKNIIDEVMVPFLKRGDYTEGIQLGVEKVINQVTIEVTFFEWYKYYIYAGVAALISLLIAISIDKKENAPLFWVLLAIVGFLILYIIRGIISGEASFGHGGGSSSGGGASGSF